MLSGQTHHTVAQFFPGKNVFFQKNDALIHEAIHVTVIALGRF